MNFQPINFIILSPDPNIGRLKGTTRSIKNNYGEASVICVVGKDTNDNSLDEMKKECPVFEGESTVTSLMNEGLKNSNAGWCMFVMEGALIPKSLQSRYFRWIENEKDILFPIVVNYNIQGEPMKIIADFPSCTLNGIMINNKFFKKVGKFSDNPIRISKEFWGAEAAMMGAKFKAILGVKIC